MTWREKRDKTERLRKRFERYTMWVEYYKPEYPKAMECLIRAAYFSSQLVSLSYQKVDED